MIIIILKKNHSYFKALQSKKFVYPFGLKIRRVGRLIFLFPVFLFFNLDTEGMQYHSGVCIMESPRS